MFYHSTDLSSVLLLGNSFGNNPPIGNRGYGLASPNHGVGNQLSGSGAGGSGGGAGDWGSRGHSTQGGNFCPQQNKFRRGL